MKQPVKKLYDNLYKQVGAYRYLLEALRKEHAALTDANSKGLQEAVAQKENLLHTIQNAEAERLQLTADLAIEWKLPLDKMILAEIIKRQQTSTVEDPELATQLQRVLNTLRILVDRVTKQNRDNGALVERSIEHIEAMKRNVLGEPIQKSDTYTPHGVKKPSQPTSRFLAQEG